VHVLAVGFVEGIVGNGKDRVECGPGLVDFANSLKVCIDDVTDREFPGQIAALYARDGQFFDGERGDHYFSSMVVAARQA
jgi:hypothetical protein